MFLGGGRSLDQMHCSDCGEIPSAPVLVVLGQLCAARAHEGHVRCALLKGIQTFGLCRLSGRSRKESSYAGPQGRDPDLFCTCVF